MLRSMSMLCIISVFIHVYPCETGNNITFLSPNPTEKYLIRLIRDDVSPEETLRGYLGYMCNKHGLHESDARLCIFPQAEHLRAEFSPETVTANAYVPTRIYFDANNANINTGSIDNRVIGAISVLHDMDTLVGRAKSAAILKRRYQMHPDSDAMTNLHNDVQFLRALKDGRYSCPIQYPSVIPSDAYQKQQACACERPLGVDRRKADAEAFALYETEVPGLIASHLKKVIYIATPDMQYENDALPLQQQYNIVYNRWKQNHNQETLYKYFNMDV